MREWVTGNKWVKEVVTGSEWVRGVVMEGYM